MLRDASQLLWYNQSDKKKSSLSALLRELRTDSSVLIGLVLQGPIFTELCIFKVVSMGSCRNALGAASSLKLSYTLMSTIWMTTGCWIDGIWCIYHICVLFRVWYAFVCSYPWASSCNKKRKKQSCGDMEGLCPRRLMMVGASFTLPSMRFRSRRMARRFMSWISKVYHRNKEASSTRTQGSTGYRRIHNLRLFVRTQANTGENLQRDFEK